MDKRNATEQGTGIQHEQQQCGVGILVLNDQGGAQMSISYDVTATLREQMKHHEPIVLIRGGDAPVVLFQERAAKQGLLDMESRCCRP